MAADEVVLRGFDMPVSDIGDQLHFRQPLLSFRGSPTLYLAGRVDWHADRQALLTVVDDPEDRELATLLTDGVSRYLAPGEGVVVAGADFFHAASRIGDQLGDFSHLSAADCECWIRMATPAEFVALERKLIDESRAVFDQELGKARLKGSRLMERGNAAMLILSSCGPLRREDLAIRQLAAARQNRDFDLYRRLLARFEHELCEPEDRLEKQAGRHIELTADALEGNWPGLNMLESMTDLVYDELAEHGKHKQWRNIAAFSRGVLMLQSSINPICWQLNRLADHSNLTTEGKSTSDILWCWEGMKTLSAGSKSGTKGGLEEIWSQA